MWLDFEGRFSFFGWNLKVVHLWLKNSKQNCLEIKFPTKKVILIIHVPVKVRLLQRINVANASLCDFIICMVFHFKMPSSAAASYLNTKSTR